MAGQLVSPKNAMKLNNINAARKIKNGSPKIRDVLRQRCRQRMHERREDIFFKRRQGLTNYSDEVKNALTDIVHEEFENIVSMECAEASEPSLLALGSDNLLNKECTTLDEPLEIDELIEEQWILEEYQKVLWEQKHLQSMFIDEVICPICLKNSLQEIQNLVICHCGLRLPVQNGLHGLKLNIQEQVNTHSTACLDVPKFSIFQDSDHISLCFSCMSCDIFALV